MRTRWAIEDRENILTSLDDCAETVLEDELGATLALEYRPPDFMDIDADSLADDVWSFISDRINEDEDICHDDGCPCLNPPYFRAGKIRPLSWNVLRDAVQEVLSRDSDMSEAAWVPTGKTVLIAADGTYDVGD